MNDWVELAPALRRGPPDARGRQTRGAFIERPHRFAARVCLPDGSVAEAHLPNPGRLTGVLSPGCDLALEGPFPLPRALPYSVLAARAGRVWVGAVPAYANAVFPQLLVAGLFPELVPGDNARPTAIRREVQHGRSRFDFEVDGRLVEVKSVSMAERGAGLFPDAVTARGARHCEELAAHARRGRPAAIVFVAQRGDVTSVAAARDVDPVFADALATARRAGVLLLACALRMGPNAARAARRVPVLP